MFLPLSSFFGFASSIVYHSEKGDYDGLYKSRAIAYYAQSARCYCMGWELLEGLRELHHRFPRFLGGDHEPHNLVYLNIYVHKLIHTHFQQEIVSLLEYLSPTAVQLSRINQLRTEAFMPPILNYQEILLSA